MGFLDKAKKMAEQAQAKLDEVQTQFNEGQGGGAAGVRAGRRVRQARPPDPAASAGDRDAAAGRPARGHVDPAAARIARPRRRASRRRARATRWARPRPPPRRRPPVADPPVAAPGVPPTADAAPSADPAAADALGRPGRAAPSADAAAPGNAGVPEDRNKANYEPPKLSSGDPLAG